MIATVLVPALLVALQTPPEKPLAKPATVFGQSIGIGSTWLAPLRVPVTETRKLHGTPITLHYELAITRDEALGALRVALEGVTLERIGEHAAKDVEVAADRRTIEPRVLAVPDLVLKAAAVVEPVGWDAAVARSCTHALEAKLLEPAAIDELERTLLSSRGRFAAERSMRDAWDAWSGAWSNLNTSVLEPEKVVDLPVGLEGVLVPSKRKRSFGKLEEVDGVQCAQVTSETAQEGDALARALEQASASPGGKPDVGSVVRASRWTTVKATLETATGRPRTAEIYAHLGYTLRSGQKIEESELRTFAFDWSHAAPPPK